MLTTKVLLALFVAFSVPIVLGRLFSKKRDPREPPLLPSGIPYVGHIIGMLTQGVSYFAKVRYGNTGGYSLKQGLI
jgi:hypothetical protein